MPTITPTQHSTDERIRTQQRVRSVQEMLDDLRMQRAKIDLQIESLEKFLAAEDVSEAPRTTVVAPKRTSQPARAQRTIGVAQLIQSRLRTDKPLYKAEIVEAVAREHGLSMPVAREKVKSSLKDLVRRGRAVRGNETGSYFAPKK